MKKRISFKVISVLLCSASISFGGVFTKKLEISDPEIRKHAIFINKYGRFLPPYNMKEIPLSDKIKYDYIDEKIIDLFQAPVADEIVYLDLNMDDEYFSKKYSVKKEDIFQIYLNDIFYHIEQIKNEIENDKEKYKEGFKGVLLFIHGGLNTWDVSIDRTETCYKKILESGYYPIFINWHSGPVSSFSEQILFIREGKNKGGNALFSIPTIITDSIVKPIAEIPSSWWKQGLNFSKDYKYFYPFVKFYKQEDRLQDYNNRKNFIVCGNGKNTKQKFANFFQNSFGTFFRPVSTPFIDSIGQKAWDNMCRRTKLMFDREIRKCSCFEENVFKFGECEKLKAGESEIKPGALTIFIKKLMARLQAEDWAGMDITLIGHSMGTIVIDNMLSRWPESNHNIKKIVYMGAATSIKSFIDNVTPYLNANSECKFYNLTLYPESETRELMGWGFLPNGSLLVYIDDLYTDPQTMLEKRLGVWDNCEQAYDAFPKSLINNNQINFKVFGWSGYKVHDSDEEIDHIKKHGDFSRADFWKEEFYSVE